MQSNMIIILIMKASQLFCAKHGRKIQEFSVNQFIRRCLMRFQTYPDKGRWQQSLMGFWGSNSQSLHRIAKKVSISFTRISHSLCTELKVGVLFNKQSRRFHAFCLNLNLDLCLQAKRPRSTIQSAARKEMYVDHEKVAIFCESCWVCQQRDNDRFAGSTFGAFQSQPCESLYSGGGCTKPACDTERLFRPQENVYFYLHLSAVDRNITLTKCRASKSMVQIY